MTTYENYLQMVQRDGMNLQSVPEKYQTPEICEEAIRKSGGMAIEFIKNQTQELCDMAVGFSHKNPNLLILKHIKPEFQTPVLLKAAVTHNPWVISQIKQPTEELSVIAVKHEPRVLREIKEQTPKICYAAVVNSGMMLQYVERQFPNICKAAIENDPLALQHVRKQKPEICLAALKKAIDIDVETDQPGKLTDKVAGFIKLATKEFWLEAVKLDWHLLANVVEKYGERTDVSICNAAIEQNADAFNLIKDKLRPPMVYTILSRSLELNGNMLKHITQPTENEVERAVKQTGQALQYVPERLITPRLQLTAIQNFGPMISEVANPTEEMMFEAVKQEGTNLQFIKGVIPNEVYIAAFLNNKEAIEFIPETAREAVERISNAITNFEQASTKDRIEVATILPKLYNMVPVKRFIDLRNKMLHDASEKVIAEAVRQGGFFFDDVPKLREHGSELVREALNERIQIDPALDFNDKITDFIKAMHEEYSIIYDKQEKHEPIPGYSEAAKMFDDTSKQNKIFLQALAGIRKDFISSDRECAAFTFAVLKNPELVRECKPAFNESVFKEIFDAFTKHPDPKIREYVASFKVNEAKAKELDVDKTKDKSISKDNGINI